MTDVASSMFNCWGLYTFNSNPKIFSLKCSSRLQGGGKFLKEISEG